MTDTSPARPARSLRRFPALLRLALIACCGLPGVGVRSGAVAADEAAPLKIAVPTPIRAEDVRPHIEFLAHPDRQGRQGAGLAASADFIETRFRELKLEPLFGTSFRQAIPDGSSPPSSSGTAAIEKSLGTNLGAMLPGRDETLRKEYILVTAHYDHLGVRRGRVYPGADDNASGVAMMLECARQFAALPERPRRTICFVAFDLEERLLYGSRWFAAHPPWDIHQIKLFITADMLGRSLGDLPLPAVFVLGSERSDAVRGILDRLQPPPELELARIGADIVGTRSDYGPFRDYRIPFLFFSSGEHPDYHTPRDTADKIDFAKVARVSNVVLTIARTAADADEAPRWQPDPPRDMEEVRTLLRVTDLVLEQEAAGGGAVPVSDLQLAFITQVNSKCRYMMKRGSISGEERIWLARAAQVLMFSLF